MARGVENGLVTIHREDDGTTYSFDFDITIAGPDVEPGGTYGGVVRAQLTASDTLATFESKRAAAIRARATEIGASIAANQVLLIQFKAA